MCLLSNTYRRVQPCVRGKAKKMGELQTNITVKYLKKEIFQLEENCLSF